MKASGIVFDALGDPMRRTILEKLRKRPLAVGNIAKGLPVSRPAVSQHIKVLERARLICIDHQGTKSICRIDFEGMLAVRNYLDQFWGDALAAFKVVAEKTEKSKKKL